ncbi:nucleotidyltransferase domain-containing protein [Aerophototrophica crusticola]|uniref:Nucleotidyltransferase domain-containing protein n=1 Tax=Aerophototrophica crusticola TaxID=1709002 RepID=A0A858RAC5_9PROT|nr:nucleotidyltransferase domain-containing protein [Rhodospirillaceae bacterium B3]
MAMAERKYPTYQELRARRLAELRATAIEAVRGAERLARARGGHLVVFGSLATGRLHERSDIDVALYGVPPGQDLAVAAEVMSHLNLAGFEADVLEERFLSPSLKARIERDGRLPGDLA